MVVTLGYSRVVPRERYMDSTVRYPRVALRRRIPGGRWPGAPLLPFERRAALTAGKVLHGAGVCIGGSPALPQAS